MCIRDRYESAHGLQPYIYKGEAEAVSPVEKREGNYDENNQLYIVILGHDCMNSFEIQRIVTSQSKRYQDTRYDDQNRKNHCSYHATS